ncbi:MULTISPECIES: hypothetical protein [unclassified Microcoleus]|uniref:hypothetical protein n=1 Tax=unclassified Microcoleus TaxID=2642155 RepID=UPI0025EF3959|nr:MULTISPECIES: hypothetical protein [unclassified Microcoleus]
MNSLILISPDQAWGFQRILSGKLLWIEIVSFNPLSKLIKFSPPLPFSPSAYMHNSRTMTTR